jgi:hypothetical protein
MPLKTKQGRRRKDRRRRKKLKQKKKSKKKIKEHPKIKNEIKNDVKNVFLKKEDEMNFKMLFSKINLCPQLRILLASYVGIQKCYHEHCNETRGLKQCIMFKKQLYCQKHRSMRTARNLKRGLYGTLNPDTFSYISSDEDEDSNI